MPSPWGVRRCGRAVPPPPTPARRDSCAGALREPLTERQTPEWPQGLQWDSGMGTRPQHP
jgi:hypothetical protein